MLRSTRCIGSAMLYALLVACASVDVKEMALKSAGVDGNTDIDSGLVCKDTPYLLSMILQTESVKLTPADVTKAEKSVQNAISAATKRYDDLQLNIPESLRETVVVQTVIRSAKLKTAEAIGEAFEVQNFSRLGEKEVQAINGANATFIKTNLEQPASLRTRDFRYFVDEFSEQLQRHTKKKGSDDSFWELVEKYYSAYAGGSFVDYFGVKYDKPSLSLTVTDAELANSAGVFLELLFDAAAGTPVWIPEDIKHTGDLTAGSKQLSNIKGINGANEDVTTLGWKAGMSISDKNNAIPNGTTIAVIAPQGLSLTLSNAATQPVTAAQLTVTESSKTYYPGASTSEPSVLTISGRDPEPISLNEHDFGCGMTIPKAKAVNAMAQGFGSAASNASGAAVGTIGGVGFSLFIFGKVSIGDNKAVTSLLEALVSELVKRLTVEATYPVLKDIVFHDPGDHSEYHLTSPFESPNAKTVHHNAWLP